MTNNYLDKLAKLLKQARPRLASTHSLEFKNVFGAVGGYLNGVIFISCGKFGIALRLSPIEKGISPYVEHLPLQAHGVE